MPTGGSFIWSLVACVGALGLIPQLGSQALPYLPSDGLAGLLADALNYALNIALALGTPYLAWHVGAVQGPVRIASQVVSNLVLGALIIQNVVAAAGAVYLPSGTLKGTLLWGALVNWWFLGIMLLPRSYLENGYWWFRIALAFKLSDVLLSGI
ncbi:hypothetical protein F4821DRAFT_22379 [Hypoxylon rubiginosum]|uniref:Uncharacterized protein n=1 Tax=Hypoxylon rubiginosum TaxID=110542 RepID=A0ACC0DDC2_9PEZI|nr:hypothetical protein F4821DRAFT_22379 [Hypoxylon rubiginosum]